MQVIYVNIVSCKDFDYRGGLIQAGASLVGTTLSAIQDGAYARSVGGEIENYSKYSLRLRHCENAIGMVNEPMRDVSPGYKEGFASHNSNGALKGTKVYCYYTVKNIQFHIMYYVPHGGSYNYLALGLTPFNATNYNAAYMYKTDPSTDKYFTRKAFYYEDDDVELCEVGFCVDGTMTSLSAAQIKIKFFPREYDDLIKTMQEKMVEQSGFKSNGQGENEEARKKEMGEKQYTEYMTDEFNHEFTSNDDFKCTKKKNKRLN